MLVAGRVPANSRCSICIIAHEIRSAGGGRRPDSRNRRRMLVSTAATDDAVLVVGGHQRLGHGPCTLSLSARTLSNRFERRPRRMHRHLGTSPTTINPSKFNTAPFLHVLILYKWSYHWFICCVLYVLSSEYV